MSSEKKKKRRFLSAISSPFRALRRRLPSPEDDTCLVVNGTSNNATTPESLGTSSRNLPRFEDSQTITNQRPHRREPTRPIAMFSDIEQLHIGVGNFVQNINHRDNSILKHVAFQFLPRSRDAAFSAAINFDNLARRSCTKGTRVDIIAQINAWINEKDPSKAPPVYWLAGLAGLGKTTIAYTICESLNDARVPFISYFCSLQLDSRNSKLLVTTLCRSLAELYDPFAANVLSTLETNSKVVDDVLRIQIDELLAKPWQASIRQCRDLPTAIVVVDALDECDRGTEFLTELLRVIHANQLTGIKFLVTSRPEPKIVNLCRSFPPNAVCKLHEVDTANVQDDILKYLREALPELEDEPELVLLSERAGGLFIYATTAVRFISPLDSSRSVSEMRFHLQAILSSENLSFRDPSDESLLVDELYGRILAAAFRDTGVRATRLRILHTIICAESRIDASVLANLMDTDQDTVKKVAETLHAVLYISSKDGCVYWYHASFPDFVFSQTRTRISILPHTKREFDAYCDAPAHHGVLARRCFSVMQNFLHFNMCNLPSSYLLDSEVPNLDVSIAEAFSLTLRYVLRHWARHLLRAAPAEDGTDDLFCGLKEFVDKKLLFWMEGMNLIGAKYECSPLLKDAESWLDKGNELPDLLSELADATRFSAFFAGSVGSKSTPHLYISALSTWNQDSPIWKKWKDRFQFIPSISLPKGKTITIPLLTIPTTHPIACAAFSPDGNRIVSGSYDQTVRVWDAKTGEQLKEMHGHFNFVASVAFSSDGSRIVSGSEDYSVRVWDANTGEQLKQMKHTSSVKSVAFSPEDGRIIACSYGGSLWEWDLKTGEQRTVQELNNCINSIAFSPDGNRIASCSYDTIIRIWDSTTDMGKLLKELKGHTGSVASVVFSSDGNRIVSGSADKSVRVWDAKTSEQLRVLQGHSGSVTSVAISPDGSQIASSSYDHLVLVWDTNVGELLRELHGHTDIVTSVAFSFDGSRIVSCSDDHSVLVWDAKMGEQLEEPQGHTDIVTSIAFSPDGNQIVSGSADKSVRVWDTKTGELLRELEGHTGPVNSVGISPDGNRLVSGSDDKSVRLWDSKMGMQLRELQGHTSFVNSVSFSPDGSRIISGSVDKSIRMWDPNTGQELKELRGHTSSVDSVAFSSDGNRIVSGSYDKSVRVWDAKAGKQLWAMRSGHVSSVGFSSDGNRIVSGSSDGTVVMWDAKTSKQVGGSQGRIDSFVSAAFSPDGNRVVTGSFDRSVRVWDAKTFKQLRELQGHTSRITSVAFSPDGNLVISCSADRSVRVWGHLDFDASWAVQPDGWIVSSGGDRLAWVPSSICHILLRPHNVLIISPNGSATISFDGCKLGPSWHECSTF